MHVTRTREVARLGGRINSRQHGRCAIGRRNAGRGLPNGVDRRAERRLEARRVLRHHQWNLELVEALRRHRQTNQAAAVLRHEVDRLGRHLLGRDRQIPFVFPIRIVHDDDHTAGAKLGDRVFDPRERRIRFLGNRELLHTLPAFRPASSAARATYLPTRSHSRLTGSCTRARARFVCSIVYGTSWTTKCSVRRPATVRLMPSTATEPLWTKNGANDAGKLTVNQWNSCSGRSSSIRPTPSTCPCTK